MDNKAIPNEEFLAIRNSAINNDPITMTMPMANVIFSGEGYKGGWVELLLKDGRTRTYVTPNFFKLVAKMLNFNIGLSSRMDEESFGSLMQAVKVLQSTKNAIGEVTVVYDQIQKKLTHISSGAYNRISNELLFNFAEGIVDKNPDLKIIKILGGKETSDVGFHILSSEQVGLQDVMSNDPEEFQFGITLSNRGVSTIVGDFAYRLICTNGMMSIKTDDRFKLEGTDGDSLFKLFQHFEVMQKEQYIPKDFNENVSTASNIPASYGELNSVYRTIISGLVPEFPEHKPMIAEAIKTRFFSEMIVVEQKLKARGFDIEEITPQQMKFIKTDKTMWELVNIATDLGSNNHPYPLNNKITLQQLGGKLLTRPFDLKELHLLLL